MPPPMSPPPESTRPPGLSVRAKLTLSYAGLVIVAGAVMFAVGFLLLRFVPEGSLIVDGGGWAPNRSNLLEVFVRYAWWAIAALVAFGLLGGWVLSGVVLRPLERITDAARRARDGSLDHRIGLPGRRDELTDLADTFDSMLARVQHTIDEERRFAANASHELRTPHTIIRTMVEVAQADPEGRDVDVLLARIGATNDRAIAITESLLALARVGRGVEIQRTPIDLPALVAEGIELESTDAAARGVRLHLSASPVSVAGDRTLIERLVANVLHNAVVHNSPGGSVWVTVGADATSAVLSVENSGPVVEPRRRGDADRAVRACRRAHPRHRRRRRFGPGSRALRV